jgi:ABC-2 type transport system ATP-binding protein
MRRDSIDRLFHASCVYLLPGLVSESPQRPAGIQPKAPSAVNKAMVADQINNWAEMPQPPGALTPSICLRGFTAPKRFWLKVRIRRENRSAPRMQHVETALALRGLTKRFDRLAVDALDLTIHSGEFYALLGPNGAGKTTTLRMVAGLLRPDAGSVSVLGIDALKNPVAAKQMMAWVSDEPMIYDKLTPLEYLEFVAGLWGIDAKRAELAAQELLVSLGLEPHLGERCEGFSKGMRQKVALAGALVHEPRLIILDEPLTGLDALSARHVKGLLQARVRAGCTVIMTTHILEVAERMADRIGVIAAGRLVAEGTLEELRRQNGRNDTSLEDMFIALVDAEAAAA